MLSKNEIWDIVAAIAGEEGYGLFDLECAHGMHGVLRVFLCQTDGSTQGVDLGACARVAKRINNLVNVDDLIPGDSTLEVSSPGINRKLSRVEHFRGAIGERLRITFMRMSDGLLKKDTVRGVLRAFDGEKLEIEREERQGAGLETVLFSSIQEARVDFLFK